MAYKSFEELEVWKNACDLSVELYQLLKHCRYFGLRDQITRSAVSVASNIAEGAERGSKAEFVRFLHIAKGSAAELRTQIHIAERIGLLSDLNCGKIIEQLIVISKQLHSLITYLKLKT